MSCQVFSGHLVSNPTGNANLRAPGVLVYDRHDVRNGVLVCVATENLCDLDIHPGRSPLQILVGPEHHEILHEWVHKYGNEMVRQLNLLEVRGKAFRAVDLFQRYGLLEAIVSCLINRLRKGTDLARPTSWAFDV